MRSFIQNRRNLLKLLSTVVFLIILVTCKDDKVILTADVPKDYTVRYKKDTIILHNEDNPEMEKFIKINNEYYLFENGKKKLFFSTITDSIYTDEQDGDVYKVEINKLDNSTFKTSYYLINHLDQKIILSSFFYDVNYKLLKIQKGGTIDYKP